MTASDIEVDPGVLQQIGSVLDGAGQQLFGHAPDLQTPPDAGASSGEVAKSMASLAAAVAALAQHIGSLAESTRTVSADFTGTDGAVADVFTPSIWGPRGLMGP